MTEQTAQSPDDIAPAYRNVAVRWLVWDRGMTIEDAEACIQSWPDHDKASEAIDVATFIVDECHGR
jgi:hypothetical protein